MSLFLREDHGDNPPETWKVVKRATGLWDLRTKDGTVITSEGTKRECEQHKMADSWFVKLYEKEGRWYAGQDVQGWKPGPYVPASRVIHHD